MTCRPILLSCLLALGLLGACSGPDPAVSPVYAGPRPGGAGEADQAAVVAACRRDADRIVTTRDRGQLMREDERDSRVGSQASIYSQRAETDRLGRLFERDRLADQCVQENTRAAPQR